MSRGKIAVNVLPIAVIEEEFTLLSKSTRSIVIISVRKSRTIDLSNPK